VKADPRFFKDFGRECSAFDDEPGLKRPFKSRLFMVPDI